VEEKVGRAVVRRGTKGAIANGYGRGLNPIPALAFDMLSEGEELPVPALEITGNDPVRHIQNLRDVGPTVRCNPEPAQKIEMKRGVGAQKHIALLRCS
jgi:hypothetical protein